MPGAFAETFQAAGLDRRDEAVLTRCLPADALPDPGVGVLRVAGHCVRQSAQQPGCFTARDPSSQEQQGSYISDQRSTLRRTNCLAVGAYTLGTFWTYQLRLEICFRDLLARCMFDPDFARASASLVRNNVTYPQSGIAMY